MTTLHTAPENARPRGSARLLAAWGEQMIEGDPLEEIAAELARSGGPDALDGWSRSLRRHGGRPSRPHAITDGVPLTRLVRSGAGDSAAFARTGVLDA